MTCKAIIFDYIGTLVNCRNYYMANSEIVLYRSLVAENFELDKKQFLDAYRTFHKKYRIIRYQQFREVTNAVWVAEALTSLGVAVTPDDIRLKTALNMFFQDFIKTVELREGAMKLLKETSEKFRLGLISNFTHGPVIHKSLRKLGIDSLFNVIVVSDDIGWRKPSPLIFEDMLKRLKVRTDEAVFIGDSPLEDIKGANDFGLKTVFVQSQFNSLKDLIDSQQVPDYTVDDLLTLFTKIHEITR
ncbi:MAG: HAD family hydrolase [Crenarchaeota archaeon]|jgi:HAD superfamily hydrolase (TIGR01549 family)|nr:HAD family hydrolase [Thermoproteota archaeon]